MTGEEALKLWDKIFESYDSLINEITEEGKDYKEATLKIDRFCIEQLRSVIGSHYADSM